MADPPLHLPLLHGRLPWFTLRVGWVGDLVMRLFAWFVAWEGARWHAWEAPNTNHMFEQGMNATIWHNLSKQLSN